MNNEPKKTEQNLPPKSVSFASKQQYCSRCQSKVNLCNECQSLITENTTMYCINGDHVHTFCLSSFLEHNP